MHPAGVPDERASPLAVGVVLWLASEVMFFGGLFAAWFVLRAHNEPNWPPPDEQLDVARMAFFTLVLVSSSLTVHMCVVAGERNQRASAMRWLALTIVLGATFLVNEGFEYAGLDFGFSSSAFSTIFFLLTGFHGAHVFGGLVIMTVVGWLVFSRPTRVPKAESLRVMSYYWHFVDVVWVILFLVVYVIQ